MEQANFWDERYDRYGHTGWSNQQLYDYDQKNRLNYFARFLSGLKCQQLLDIGCGTGDFIALLGQMFPQANIKGLDISPLTVQACADRFKHNQNIEIATADITQAQLGTDMYDLVVSMTVLQHITEIKTLSKVLLDIRKSLVTEGRFVFLENVYSKGENTDYLNRSFSRKDWISLCQDQGFIIEHSGPYPQWGVVLVEGLLSNLNYLKRLVKRMKASDNPQSSYASNQMAGSTGSGQLKKVLMKLMLSASAVLDRKLSVPVPRSLVRYELFVCRAVP